ncbi:discoidin domain-containing protein [Allorhizobium taibaishanense]|uniref:Carbohydrate-binding protein n=1 Tax=Allorhizobium taibaishanense TaxID=887144 RepID=A0A1Q9A798_9HYPH|nr:discoidin domain-containing protein [Allorhizobium taibaishanense]MBB4008382.1 hypothetical protein [Allorhizobium taibaishanense]OLP50441.1 carbohydrate-binding protein [Allorhizobium taibaishanense]
MQVTLGVTHADGRCLAQVHGEEEAWLVYRDAYREGDRLQVELSAAGHVRLALDAAMTPALVYLPQGQFSFSIPFDSRRKAYPPHAFQGDLHRLFVAQARPEEVAARRNLALNPWDGSTHDGLGAGAAFPHAFASAETRGEAAFAARTAIDGEKANAGHGHWPFTSWGINRDPDAALTVDFGRLVTVDEVVLYLRADFPHDAWWQAASLSFSNGETQELVLDKTDRGQSFRFPAIITEWVKLHRLIKADDPSPYPALTQIEVWGIEA